MIGNERQVWYDKLLERISRLVPSFGGAGGKEEGRHGKADAGLSGSGHLHAGAGGLYVWNVLSVNGQDAMK